MIRPELERLGVQRWNMFSEIRDLLGRFVHKSNKEPPLIVTSKPVLVKDFYSSPTSRRKSFTCSLAVHLGVILFLIFVVPEISERKSGRIVYIPSERSVLFLPLFNKPGPSGGGGGGGDRSPLPPSKGKLPKFNLNELVPPKATEAERKPLLAQDPAMAVPPEIQIVIPDMPQFGDPFGKISPPSSGPGSGSGIGTGSGGGVGPGRGLGVGPGSGGGVGGGAFRIGGGVSAPQLLYKVDPEYSEEARKAKHQGVVELYIEVEPNGTVSRVMVRKNLGLGLDEKAIEAVRRWKFKPGLKDGKAVTVGALVTVTFRLL